MGEGAGLFNIDPAVLLLQVTGFVILYLLLRRYLFRPLLGVMEEREKELVTDGREVELDVRPYGIVTLRVVF